MTGNTLKGTGSMGIYVTTGTGNGGGNTVSNNTITGFSTAQVIN